MMSNWNLGEATSFGTWSASGGKKKPSARPNWISAWNSLTKLAVRSAEPIAMNPLFENRLWLSRRQFFGRSAVGLGTVALASLLNEDFFAAPTKAASSTSGQ